MIFRTRASLNRTYGSSNVSEYGPNRNTKYFISLEMLLLPLGTNQVGDHRLAFQNVVFLFWIGLDIYL